MNSNGRRKPYWKRGGSGGWSRYNGGRGFGGARKPWYTTGRRRGSFAGSRESSTSGGAASKNFPSLDFTEDDGRRRPVDTFSEPCSVAESECSNASRNPALNIVQTVLEDFQSSSPYKGWRLYFPAEPFVEGKEKHKLIEACREFILEIQECAYDADEIRRTHRFYVDAERFCKSGKIAQSLDGYGDDVVGSKFDTDPEMIVQCAGLAMHTLLTESTASEPFDDSDEELSKMSEDLPQIVARFVNFRQPSPVKNLQYSSCNKMVTVQGVVVKLSLVRPKCTRLAFECSLCKSNFALILPDGNYVAPVKCLDAECRSRTFRPLRQSTKTETVDWQKIRLQDLASGQSIDDCGLPKSVECELIGDLVDSCSPGNVVTITGVLKVSSVDEIKRRNKICYAMYIAVNSVVNVQGSVGATNLNEALDLSLFRRIRDYDDPFGLLIESLCPHIYGHRMVKAGLLLALFGGRKTSSSQSTDDGDNVAYQQCNQRRSSIHVLVVGDPGLGKTHLLQACANVSPRGIYVSGNTTTVAGLTVCLNRDSSSGNDFAVEAGALVIADDGCCCIDEFDKMHSQYNALLEAMEQQQISVFKSGVHCQFNARAAVLAAANPYGGCYDETKSVAQNLHLNPALLNRFDLIFVLRDTPDADRDAIVTAHVMRMRASGNSSTEQRKNVFANFENENDDLDEDATTNAAPGIVPFDVLKKYIHYARHHVDPTVSPEAVEELTSFFAELQNQSKNGKDRLPVGVRQFESLLRLTQARAKCELTDVALPKHVRDVVDIVRYSMSEVDTGNNSLDGKTVRDSEKKMNKRPPSQKEQMETFLKTLKTFGRQKGDYLFSGRELKEIYENANLSWLRGFEELLNSLNNNGYLLSKGSQMYQYVHWL